MEVIALYLPQFHRIPENDKWWGEGFTEWDNVKSAKPLFDGHEQPRVPLNGNYYDLSNPSTLRWQVDLAKEYGIGGFCFYHYWFGGHMLLEKPMEDYLVGKSLDLPFCICWANEHWTNQWVSSDQSVLIEQNYGGLVEWKEHFDYLSPFLLDERYIKIDGKPLLVIYRPELIRCLEEMIETWESLAIELGLPGLAMCYQHPGAIGGLKASQKALFRFNVEGQPGHARQWIASNGRSATWKAKQVIKRTAYNIAGITLRAPRVPMQLRPLVFESYDDIWQAILEAEPSGPSSIPCGIVDWDNTPRYGEHGSVFTGVTVEKFRDYFFKLLVCAHEKYHSEFVFLFAWNEWAEGGYLEPDEARGYGFLEAVKSALDSFNHREDYS